jgi:hypothetical protein
MLLILWFVTARADHDLFRNRETTTGRITSIIRDSNNEGSIVSWDVYYEYFDQDSVRRKGKVDGSRETSRNDTVYVVYAAEQTACHYAYLEKKEYSAEGIGSFLFRGYAQFVFLLLIVVGRIFFLQIDHWSKREHD